MPVTSMKCLHTADVGFRKSQWLKDVRFKNLGQKDSLLSRTKMTLNAWKGLYPKEVEFRKTLQWKHARFKNLLQEDLWLSKTKMTVTSIKCLHAADVGFRKSQGATDVRFKNLGRKEGQLPRMTRMCLNFWHLHLTTRQAPTMVKQIEMHCLGAPVRYR
ncbi:hypothetical protein C7212DRAFT_340435 [Tuber magnatum]|uniref:Uncharacterized protein n=1 Tax=Tuber magnatum TaxID=42249 RepID=A0A317T2R3_9PEZI|nr:hypothetical protein C7212DRAFT_340435 [Tuber magnatum]